MSVSDSASSDLLSSESSPSPTALATPAPSSTNLVDDFLVTSADEHDSDVGVPWRSGADSLDRLRRNAELYTYVGHSRWLVTRQELREMERPVRIRRKIIVRPAKRPYPIVVYEDGYTRDFFLIIALCFVLAVLMIVFLRPIALEILDYYMD